MQLVTRTTSTLNSSCGKNGLFPGSTNVRVRTAPSKSCLAVDKLANSNQQHGAGNRVASSGLETDASWTTTWITSSLSRLGLRYVPMHTDSWNVSDFAASLLVLSHETKIKCLQPNLPTDELRKQSRRSFGPNGRTSLCNGALKTWTVTSLLFTTCPTHRSRITQRAQMLTSIKATSPCRVVVFHFGSTLIQRGDMSVVLIALLNATESHRFLDVWTKLHRFDWGPQHTTRSVNIACFHKTHPGHHRLWSS